MQAEERSFRVTGSSMFSGIPTAGIPVTPHTAMNWLPYYCAVSIISNTIATADVNVKRRLARGREIVPTHPVQRIVNCTPDGEITSATYRRTKMSHVLTTGNGYGEIERSFLGKPLAQHLMNPYHVQPVRDRLGKIWFEQKEGASLPNRDVVHWANLSGDALVGASPASIGAEAISYGLGIQTYGAAFYGNSSQPPGYFSTPGKTDPKAIENFQRQQQRVHRGAGNAHRNGVMPPGWGWVSTAFSPKDGDYIAARGHQIQEMARLFNMPAHMLADLTNATFSNIEEQHKEYYDQCIRPWLTFIEAQDRLKLFSEIEQGSYYTDYDMTEYLRANTAVRTAFYKDLFAVGAIDPNTISDLEGWNPSDEPEADQRFVPLNMIALSSLGKPSTPEAVKEVTPDDQADDDSTSDTAPEAVPEVNTTPEAVTPSAPSADVQATALNGAQIASLLSIVSSVAAGQLPVLTAKAVISASFPTLTGASVDAILDPLDGFKAPEAGGSTPPEAPADPPASPAAPDPVSPEAEPDTSGKEVKSRVVITTNQASELRTIAAMRDFQGKVLALDEFFKTFDLGELRDQVSNLIAEDRLNDLNDLITTWEGL